MLNIKIYYKVIIDILDKIINIIKIKIQTQKHRIERLLNTAFHAILPKIINVTY